LTYSKRNNLTPASLRRLLPAIYALLAAVGSALLCPPAIAEELTPTLDLPDSASASSDDYFPLLLTWSRDVTIGPSTARVTYLDPALYAAWMKQKHPDAGNAEFRKQLDGFPGALRFRVGFRAASANLLKARDWKVSLKDAAGKMLATSDAIQISPPDLKGDDNGSYWEEAWDYRFDTSASFLKSAKGFAIDLDGPSGSGEASWNFGNQAKATQSDDGYLPYLGWTLTIFCMLLVVALFSTRPREAT
jgi:hypothetical protein